MSSIDGMDEVLDMLDGLKDEIMQAALKGLKKGLKRTVREAKALCPVDTGQLRNSIIDVAMVRGGQIEAEVGATAEYAVYVEMGTGPKGEANHAGISPNANPTYSPKGWVYKDPKTGEFRYTNGMPARPFLYPAYKLTRDKIVGDVKKAIDNRNKGG